MRLLSRCAGSLVLVGLAAGAWLLYRRRRDPEDGIWLRKARVPKAGKRHCVVVTDIQDSTAAWEMLDAALMGEATATCTRASPVPPPNNNSMNRSSGPNGDACPCPARLAPRRRRDAPARRAAAPGHAAPRGALFAHRGRLGHPGVPQRRGRRALCVRAPGPPPRGALARGAAQPPALHAHLGAAQRRGRLGQPRGGRRAHVAAHHGARRDGVRSGR